MLFGFAQSPRTPLSHFLLDANGLLACVLFGLPADSLEGLGWILGCRRLSLLDRRASGCGRR
jgi:hypothetical protein